MSMIEKLKLVIVGHVDHGKSSLIGRLLYDTGSVSPDKMDEIKKASRQCGKEIEFAFLLDHLQEEREQGITIDTTQTFFKTGKREFVIIDAPGHVEFVKNMVTGASQAEAAILIIDAAERVQEQTKRHAFILSMLGIEQIVVVVNKMDLVGYSKDVFDSIAEEMGKFFKSVNLSATYAIPISAIAGDNVYNRSNNMGWYEGKTVLEALESLSPDKGETDKPVLLPVQDVYKINEKRIAVGRLETGRVEKDTEIIILPTRQKTGIKTVEKFLENTGEGLAGESIGITTKDPVFIERGSVMCWPGEELSVTDTFKASVFWMSRLNLSVNEKVTIRCSTQETSCEIKEISRKLNSSTLEYIGDNLDSLKNLEVGEVSIKVKKPIVVAKFKDTRALGRFVFVKDNNICAGGIITEVS